MNNQLTEQALHAAEQNMTDVIKAYRSHGASHIVFGIAIQDMQNDGLKLVKAARIAALTAPPAAAAAGEACQWPAPLPFPAHKPEVDEEHYYCLTERFPKVVQLLMWKDPNDNSEPPTWCSWDGDYWEPLLGTVTHFWPLPTPPADAA